MGTIGTQNISFSSLVSTYNSVNDPDLSTTNISLSDFRGKEFTSGSVPSSGEISINSHFKGKTWKDPTPTVSVSQGNSSRATVSGGNGTQSSPYYGYTTNRGYSYNNSTGYIEWVVSGSGTVHVHCQVWSERNYDYGRMYINGSQKWYGSGSTNTGWRSYNMSNGQKVKFQYSKDYSLSSSHDRIKYHIYT